MRIQTKYINNNYINKRERIYFMKNIFLAMDPLIESKMYVLLFTFFFSKSYLLINVTFLQLLTMK